MKVFQYIPASVLNKAIHEGKITREEAIRIKKEDLIRYTNRNLLQHLKYKQWNEFFYEYNSSKVFNHAVDEVSHILAAHAYVLASDNKTKAFELLDSLKPHEGIEFTKFSLELYLKLKSKGIQPDTPDWGVIAGMCTAIWYEYPKANKWERLLGSDRFPWHYELRPWRYPINLQSFKEDMKFKTRGNP